MKTSVANLLAALTLSLALQASAHAQQHLSQSQSQANVTVTAQINHSIASKRPETLKPFDPKPTGAFTAVAQKGLVVLSPVAPAKEGYGENYLTANPYPNQQRFNRTAQFNHDFSGIKLFGWEF